jgi:hypothetical protein
MTYRIPFLRAVGSDLIAASLPSGEIAQIEIDNPSGSWLSISTFSEQVPPYTTGWSRNIHPTKSSIDIKFVPGPTSLISTRAGDIVTIYLSDAPGVDSDGHPIVTRQDQPETLRWVPASPIDTAANPVTAISNGGGFGGPLGGATKRLRVYDCLCLHTAYANEFNRLTQRVLWTLSEYPPGGPVGNNILAGDVTPNRESDYKQLPAGFIDLALGSELAIGVDGVVPSISTYLTFVVKYAVL